MASSTDSEIAHDFIFFRVYKNSRVELIHPPCQKIPPTEDPITGVQAKDVTISTDPHTVKARIFKPKTATAKLPLLLYVHGGGFCMQSAFSPIYHAFCTTIAAKSDAIVVSVEYNMFPERSVSFCYEDSWAALQWTAAHVGGDGPEPWLNEYADFSKVFVGGDSAGGNISHHLVARVGSTGFNRAGVKVIGLVMVHPYFGGIHSDDMWLYMCHDQSGAHDPRLKPAVEDLSRLGCEKVLVIVAEKDDLKLCGFKYYEELEKSGFKGRKEIVEHAGVGHCFHLVDPTDEKANVLVEKFVSFIKQN